MRKIIAEIFLALVFLALAGAETRSYGDSTGSLEFIPFDQGDPEDAYRRGMGYGLGNDGFARDEIKSFDLIRYAAQRGHVKANYALAWIYLEGRGAQANPAAAVRFFTIAAEQGDAESQYMLAILYAQGRGVEKDSDVSLQWLNKAANKGHEEARRLLGKLSLSPATEPQEKK